MAKQFQVDLTLYQGDDWAAMITVNNCDGTPADLTGYTAQSQIRQGIADQAWRVEATLQCVIVVPSQISLSLTSLQTTVLTQPFYRWDLQVISPEGIVTTIMAGQVNMLFEVTRLAGPEEDQLRRMFEVVRVLEVPDLLAPVGEMP